MSKIAGVHVPLKPQNHAINGAMDFFQRATSATVTAQTSGSSYVADMIVVQSAGTTSKTYTSSQSSTVPTQAQSGFQSNFSTLLTIGAGSLTFAATDYVIPFSYRMEGYDFTKIYGKKVTFGFWALASVAGTYSFVLENYLGTRSYATTFVLPAATWTFTSITIQMDTAGTWAFNNAGALIIDIGGVAGTTFTATSNNVWSSNNIVAASGVTNWMTAGATLNIAQFSIVEGELGFGATGFARRGESIQAELAGCQRYVCYTNGSGKGEADTTTLAGLAASFPVPMRTTPSLTRVGTATVRHHANDFTSAAGTISNTSEVVDTNGIGQCFAVWFNLSGFTALTQFGPLYDRGTSSWLLADAGL